MSIVILGGMFDCPSLSSESWNLSQNFSSQNFWCINWLHRKLLHVWTGVRKMSLFNYGPSSWNELKGKLNIWFLIPLSKFKSIRIYSCFNYLLLMFQYLIFIKILYLQFYLVIWFGYLHWIIGCSCAMCVWPAVVKPFYVYYFCCNVH